MKKEITIGATGILALVILFFGINYLKGINMFKPAGYYFVRFADINGLAVSSPVFANGYKIGLVRDLVFDSKHSEYVTVEIEVDDNISIPQNSHAELVSEMLGTVKMNMIFNHNSTQSYQPGDTIIGISNNGIMGVAQNELLPQMQRMLPKIDSVITRLNEILADPHIRQTLANTDQLTSSLASTTQQLNKLLNRDVSQITKNMATVSENLVSISDQLKGIDYAGTIAKVNQTLDNVKLLTDKLNRKDNSLGLFLNDREMYDNLNTTLNSATNLLNDLRENPKRYVHFSVFGKKN